MQASELYVGRAYLSEVLDTVRGYLSNPLFAGQKVLLDAESEFLRALAVPMSDVTMASKYATLVKEYTHTPDWFKGADICFQFTGYEEECHKLGVVPEDKGGKYGDYNHGWSRCPCPNSGYRHCADGRIYLKNVPPEGQQLLDKSGFSFSLTHDGYDAGGHWWRVSLLFPI